jgi:hypothetical protein
LLEIYNAITLRVEPSRVVLPLWICCKASATFSERERETPLSVL